MSNLTKEQQAYTSEEMVEYETLLRECVRQHSAFQSNLRRTSEIGCDLSLEDCLEWKDVLFKLGDVRKACPHVVYDKIDVSDRSTPELKMLRLLACYIDYITLEHEFQVELRQFELFDDYANGRANEAFQTPLETMLQKSMVKEEWNRQTRDSYMKKIDGMRAKLNNFTMKLIFLQSYTPLHLTDWVRNISDGSAIFPTPTFHPWPFVSTKVEQLTSMFDDLASAHRKNQGRSGSVTKKKKKGAKKQEVA